MSEQAVILSTDGVAKGLSKATKALLLRNGELTLVDHEGTESGAGASSASVLTALEGMTTEQAEDSRVALGIDDGNGNIPVDGLILADTADVALEEDVIGLSHGTLVKFDADGNGIPLNQAPRRLVGGRVITAAEADNQLIATLGSFYMSAAEIATQPTLAVSGAISALFGNSIQPAQFFVGFVPAESAIGGGTFTDYVGNIVGFNLGTLTNPTVADRQGVMLRVVGGTMEFVGGALNVVSMFAPAVRFVSTGTATGGLVIGEAPNAPVYNPGAQNIYLELQMDATPTSNYMGVEWDLLVERLPSLSGLTASVGAFAQTFASYTLAYTKSVANGVTSTTITPTVMAMDAGATVTVNGVAVASGAASGSIALSVGANVITVKVLSAVGGAIKIYTITITRAA